MSKTQPKPETPTEILNNIVEFPPGRHLWRQQGPYLVCKECQLDHAVFVGMELIMVGQEDDGTPIMRRRSEPNLAS